MKVYFKKHIIATMAAEYLKSTDLNKEKKKDEKEIKSYYVRFFFPGSESFFTNRDSRLFS